MQKWMYSSLEINPLVPLSTSGLCCLLMSFQHTKATFQALFDLARTFGLDAAFGLGGHYFLDTESVTVDDIDSDEREVHLARLVVPQHPTAKMCPTAMG